MASIETFGQHTHTHNTALPVTANEPKCKSAKRKAKSARLTASRLIVRQCQHTQAGPE